MKFDKIIEEIKWVKTTFEPTNQETNMIVKKKWALVNEALEQAIDFIEAHATSDRWRPATEAPDENGRYLIYYQQGNQRRIFVADYEYGLGWANVWANMTILNWMPLPSEPADA